MSAHPYKSLPDHCFWSRSIGQPEPDDIDPVVRAKFTITKEDRIATAGSCFAQHLARHLARSGFNYFVTESRHPVIPETLAAKYGYGVFSARYGNVYTARQLIQLLRRAYGEFTPVDDIWERKDGRFIDPYRPQIQPDGYATIEEFERDREQHFRAIRRAVEDLDVFVFTLGLTEAWINTTDGAVYPVCPGTAGGEFDKERHQFVNFSVGDVVSDMNQAVGMVRDRNPDAKIIITVSPVPLAATAIDRSVLVSTVYSKSVLRVAAEEITRAKDYAAYFPSYEIITAAFNRGSYFGSDLRSVTERGVGHVMRLFMKHYAGGAELAGEAAAAAEEAESHAEKIVRVICEEEMLDAQASRH